MSENRPTSGLNTQMFGTYSIRHFGRTIQLTAAMEAHTATATNWRDTCGSLQERINLLVIEMDTLKEQNEALTKRCLVLEIHNDSKDDEILYLKSKVDRLARENEELYVLQLSDPVPPAKKPRPTKEPPLVITKVIDSIELLSDDDV